MTPQGCTRIRWQLLAILAKAGPLGMTRTAVGKMRRGGDQRKAMLDELDYACGEGLAEVHNGRCRLSLPAVDSLRLVLPAAVAAFFDLDTVLGRTYRQWRMDTYGGHDVVVIPGIPVHPTRYDTPIPEPKPERPSFSDTFHTQLPEPEPAGFWAPEPEPEPVSAGSFWE